MTYLSPGGYGSAFTNRVLENYNRGHNVLLAKGASRFDEIRTGHPAATDLAIGDQITFPIASVFLDLRNFTGRTFWDGQEEVTSLAHAVLSGFTDVVTRYGGHVLGLRGDGLFAGFGAPGADSRVSVALASTAVAVALDSVQSDLNPALQARGIATVQASAGADFGAATFIRSGTQGTSEVNVIGFGSNFAAKCEKQAKSWELVVGEAFSASVPEKRWLTQHENSPKEYSRDAERRSYSFYDYQWRPLLRYAESVAAEVAYQPLELVYGQGERS
ncbi:adenylate/guanylate cyclase domain-containing protein [Leifsonia shinshuensis]|uniref:adenylate/guanylate cyclase domain-containing protein n=1 Tax=Leifsonia shinshuensis TaxID=150026 RepID=UPI00285D6450|nr:adenylate/guanylate cyclase domain-containing protein [Leifsonia shinshuensis]MDR6972039.1 class 3 adenylate cyclase [Leifsonia shinshuensis]